MTLLPATQSAPPLRRPADRRAPRGARRRLGAFAVRHWLLLLGVVSLVVVVLAVDPVALWRGLRGADGRLLACMAPVAVGSYVARGVAWHAGLRHIGVRIGVIRAVAVTIAGQVITLLPAGDLARVRLVREAGATGGGVGDVAGTVVFQELLYMALLGLAAVPVIGENRAYAAAAGTLLLTLVLIVTVITWERALLRAAGLVERLPRVPRIDVDLLAMRRSFLALLQPRALVPMTVWCAVAAGLCFLLFELALHAAGVTGVSFADAAFIYALGHILSSATFVPGGLGAYEGMLAGFVALHGAPASAGAAAALLYRAFNDVLMMGLGAAVARWVRVRRGAGDPPPKRDL